MDFQHYMLLGSMFISFLLSGCQRQPASHHEVAPLTQPVKTPLPEITSQSEEGFVDLVFGVQDYRINPDSSQTIKVGGLHEGRTVGFEIRLEPSWKRGILGKEVQIPTNQGIISYWGVGPESDLFLQILDEIYRTNVVPKVMAAETAFNALSLKGDPGNLRGGPVKFKLFYEKAGPDKYAEIYTNIDLAQGKVEIPEKDEGYRQHIIKALIGE